MGENMATEEGVSLDLQKVLARVATWIARKEYSQAELCQKLRGIGIEEAHHPTILHRLQELGWVSDQRIVESTLAYKKQWGKRRMAHYLKERGISSLLYENVLSEESSENELEKAYQLWLRKFKGIIPDNPKNTQQQIRFFLSRGFDLSIVKKIWVHAKNGAEE